MIAFWQEKHNAWAAGMTCKSLSGAAGLGSDEKVELGHPWAQTQNLLQSYTPNKTCCTCMWHTAC